MIDWKRTKEEFGIEAPGDISVKKRTRVIMICDGCNKRESKKIRASKEIKDDYKFLCRKCAMNVPEVKKRVHEATAKSNRERICSKETRKKISLNLKNNWQKEEFRNKLLPKMSKRAKKQWKDRSFRELISNNSKKLWQNKDYRKKILKSLSDFRSQMPKVSRIQEILYSLLDDIDAIYYRERNDGEDDVECKIGPYSFDCVVPLENKTLLIECQGDYWHSLDDTRAKDKAKASYISNNFPNHEIKYIWEHEFLEKDRILGLLKYWLNKSDLELIDYNLSDVEIKLCQSQEYRLFLGKYHYLSRAERGGVVYGAYYKDTLIAVCSFSSLVRQNLPWDGKSTRELSRLCIHPKYQKKNLASWFVSRCIKLLDPKYKTIISYCDTTFNHNGAVYKACNFELDGEVRPDYWYVSEDGWVMHKKTLYNHASSMCMKEKEYAEANGYKKVYGKKKLRFIYER